MFRYFVRVHLDALRHLFALLSSPAIISLFRHPADTRVTTMPSRSPPLRGEIVEEEYYLPYMRPR